ncbi:MAG TPA: aminotransferase class I/II-fold pyridoxal phosphate-dependent enzyme [Vicinamibacterales bacterium]|nr:aminotransferase class I/II-fold pyridoxal phosphate-dependent enzyme [Vicinamibacterales bacterium]
MRIETFAMERLQSTWENRVEFNLSESGVHPLRLEELLGAGPASEAAGENLTHLLKQELVYTQSNGTPELRRAIAALYPGTTEEHIEVTNGGSEANYLAIWNLVEPGDEVVMMTPNYMQAWGLVRGFGGVVKPWPLREQQTAAGRRWRPDLDELTRLVTPRTKLILICNPNNPTGARLEEADLDGIATVAARHGTWILADEIYRGAELDGRETASMWDRSDRVIVTSGLSKAYGLPGLRIGWIVAPPSLAASLWSYHDYTTIAPGALSDLLARLALDRTRRPSILERTQRIIRTNYPVIRDWLASRGDAFSHAAPEAGAIVYVGYRHGINSTELVTRLRDTQSVLIVPGDHFNMDGYLRIGFGSETPHLIEGLRRLHLLLETAPV